MKSIYSRKENCCGCSACYAICTKNAISMMPDEEGFLYPKIDHKRCIDCYRCIEVCPIMKEGNLKESTIPSFFAAQHTSEHVLRNSSSGGAFTAVSDAILLDGGIVYGADFVDHFYVKHQRAETTEQRNSMRLSKYVQSDMRETYHQVKEDLKEGHPVLFTGTPCQNAGLKSFIGNTILAEKLYLCDVICFSVPSPLIWKDYIALLEEEAGTPAVGVQFRSKYIDWNRDNSKKGFLFATNEHPEGVEDHRFSQLFFKSNCINRPCCSQCRFTDIHRVADLTLADYWGIEKYHPESYNPLGVSLILINSAKGEALFQQCEQDLIAEKRTPEESLKEQKRLSEPLPLSQSRQNFWEEYKQFGLRAVLEKY